MANPVGPVYTNRFEEFVVNENGEEYTILYLADLNNDKLQREGKPPAYYWVPASVRLARKGDMGDFKYRHVHFVGVFNEDIHVGIEEGEVQGGLLAFTTTSRYPTSVLRQAEEQLLEKFNGNSDRYWGWRTRATPQFAMAPITSNITAITNLAPGRGGTAPAEGIGTNVTTGGGTPSGDGAPAGPPRQIRLIDPNRKVRHGRNFRAPTNLDAWAWEMQGQGPGSVTGGENAYAGLIGPLPSEILWAGFHGGYSPIAVTQNLLMPVWSQEIYIRITGNWDRIFQHFSAHANARYLWFSGDIKAEFNSLRINGDIEVEVHIDGTIPNGAEMNKEIEDRIDLILDKFMQQASQRIFEPAPPEVEPAQAPSGGIFSSLFGGGAGFALKYRRDTTRLQLNYEETRHHRYNQPNTISSSLEGFFNEIKNDPQAEAKYFQRLVLGGLGTKVTRIVKPVVNWPDAAKDWVGEPAAFLSVELGYPDQQGNLRWLPHVFQSTDTSTETTWKTQFAQLKEDEVEDPPSGWEPDKTFVKRRLHLTEPPGATDNEFVNLSIEENFIELDPDENGSLLSDTVLEVRADSAGKLEVRITGIDAILQDASQIVEVEFQAEGQTTKGNERPVVRFLWNYDNQNEPRYWEIFTGQLDFVPRYRYRVTVTVKGTIFSKGMSWQGPWMEGQGNGSLMIHVPTPEDEGVTVRRMTPREISLGTPVEGDGQAPPSRPTVPITEEISTPPPATPVVGPPPVTRAVASKGRTVGGYAVSESKMPPPPTGYEEVSSERSTRSSSKSSTGKRGSSSESRRELEPLPDSEGWVQA